MPIRGDVDRARLEDRVLDRLLQAWLVLAHDQVVDRLVLALVAENRGVGAGPLPELARDIDATGRHHNVEVDGGDVDACRRGSARRERAELRLKLGVHLGVIETDGASAMIAGRRERLDRALWLRAVEDWIDHARIDANRRRRMG